MSIEPTPRLLLKKAQRRTLRDQIHQQLSAAVMSGKFAPGQSLTLPGLAAALGTSLMPVREAMRQLVTERAIEMLPNRTVRIPVMTRDRFHDVTLARVALEGLTTERAAASMSKATLERLEAITREMTEVVVQVDAAMYLRLNQEFHFTIYAAADSTVLIALIESLWLQAGPFIAQTFTHDAVKSGLENHHMAIDAFRRHDPASAKTAIERDIRDAADWLMKNYAFDDVATAQKQHKSK